MKIYLARHGDYENGADDFTRGLSENGRQEIKLLADALKEKGVSVSKTIHSGKLRAQQTAEILADTLMPASIIEVITGIYPDDDPVVIASEIIPTLKTETLVVGHLPFMGRMVSQLLTGNPNKTPEAFETGTVVCMERSGNNKWEKLWAIKPSDL